MFYYYIIYKPYFILSQFSPSAGKKTLSDIFHVPKDVYPVGRLDHDSEGLLLLTNDTKINHQLLSPRHRHEKEYWVQVEGDVTQDAIKKLTDGITISIDGKRYKTQPCKAKTLIGSVMVPERNPPIRFRKNVPTTWLSLTITEGKNRQVRKMTSAAGHPTLRLIRVRIENVLLEDLQPGDIREINQDDLYKSLFNRKAPPGGAF